MLLYSLTAFEMACICVHVYMYLYTKTWTNVSLYNCYYTPFMLSWHILEYMQCTIDFNLLVGYFAMVFFKRLRSINF